LDPNGNLLLDLLVVEEFALAVLASVKDQIKILLWMLHSDFEIHYPLELEVPS
jgi:hypothetical protein